MSKEKNSKNNSSTENNSMIKEGKEYIKKLGPGIITGVSDDDPSGIATYSQAGASYGTGLSWLAAWSYPLVSTIQEMCGRIALVTGRGLASNIKRIYSRKILFACTILLFLANTLNIGADLGAMAKAVELMIPQISFTPLVVIIGLSSLLFEIYIPYKKYAKYLKWLVITVFSYIITALIIDINWAELLHSVIIPTITFSKDQIILITAVLGTTISPYLFFWQTSQEIEEDISNGQTTIASRKGATHDEVKKMKFDIWSGMFISNLVMFFIIIVCANTLFTHGITQINTASDAALALAPLAGQWAKLLFSIGIIGTGLLAVPVLAGSTAYAISESLGKKEGLHRKFKSAKTFYWIIIISIIIGILINFVGINPVRALIYSAITNGIIAPIILVFIVGISSNKKIMGEFKNSFIQKFIGWLTIIIMGIAAIASIFYMF